MEAVERVNTAEEKREVLFSKRSRRGLEYEVIPPQWYQYDCERPSFDGFHPYGNNAAPVWLRR
jgi:hypothetical protein